MVRDNGLVVDGNVMRARIYDIVSLILVGIAGCAGVIAVVLALGEFWIKCAIFAAAALVLWFAGLNFARLAIAASGRQL